MDPSPKTIELLHYPGQWNLELTGSCYSTGMDNEGMGGEECNRKQKTENREWRITNGERRKRNREQNTEHEESLK